MSARLKKPVLLDCIQLMKLPLDRTALGISIVAFALSVLFSFILLPRLVQSHNVNLDADENGGLAFNIYAGNGMKYHVEDPIALDRGPVYPYLIAALFFLAKGYSLTSVQIFQALLHAAAAYLFYLIAIRLYDRRTALIAQFLFAVHPILLWYTGRVWIETTHVFVLLTAALTIVILYEHATVYRSILVGVALGLCCLTKSIVLLFPFVLLSLLIKKYRSEGIKYGVIVMSVCYLTVLPWTLRNYAVSNSFVPVHTSLGFNLIQGDVIGEHWPEQWCCNLDFWAMGQARVDSILGLHGIATFRGVEGERALTSAALQRYVRHPEFLLQRTLANAVLFWSLSESPLKSFFFGTLQWPLLVLACVAYFRFRRTQQLLAPIVALAVYYVLLHASIVGWARYSMPLIPFLLVIAAPLLKRVHFRRAP